MRILAIFGALLLGAFLIFLGAFGARWFAPVADKPLQPVTVGMPLEAGGEQVPERLDLTTLGELLAAVDPGRRSQILDSSENFARFVEQETLNQQVLRAAYANGAEDNEAIKVLMARAGQRVLVEAYLNQIVRVNLDPNFPSDAQVREAYDKNPELFRLPQRIHLFQIFIPLAADADDAATKSAWQRAEQIVADLRAGKASFAALAKQYSGHEQSRVSDGYMGLIKVNELLPPIAEAAAKLKVDAISDPIATDSGLHVLKRGQTVEEEVLGFEAVKDQIRERLRREAMAKVRQAALEKIAEEYPLQQPPGDLEQWRETLRATDKPQPPADTGAE